MRLRRIERAAPPGWDALVAAHGGTVFHSAAWAEHTVAERPGTIPSFLSCEDQSGGITALALAFRSRTPHRWAAWFREDEWLDALPATKHGTEASAQCLSLITSSSRARGAVRLQVGSFASPQGHQVLESLGFALEQRLEFELDLDRSEEEIWNGMDPQRRNKIRKAGRLSVNLRDASNREGIHTLRRLQWESGERIVARGGPQIGQTLENANDPVAILLARGVGRIVIASVDGEPVSAGLFTCFNGMAYYNLSGHSKRALETQAPTLLLWETIKQYRQQGVHRFNLGGCSIGAIDPASPEHGVYQYKKAFGGRILECASGVRVLRPLGHAVSRLADRLQP